MDKRSIFRSSEDEKRRAKRRQILVAVTVLPVLDIWFILHIATSSKEWMAAEDNFAISVIAGVFIIGINAFVYFVSRNMNRRLEKIKITTTSDSIEVSIGEYFRKYLAADVVSVASVYSKTGEVIKLLIGTKEGNLLLEKLESMTSLNSNVLALVPHITPLAIQEKCRSSSRVRIILIWLGVFAVAFMAVRIGSRLGYSVENTGAIIKSCILLVVGMYVLIARPARKLGPTFGRFEPWAGAISVLAGVLSLMMILQKL